MPSLLPECDSYTENYEQQTTRKQPFSFGRGQSHAPLQGLDFKQCRRFIQAQRNASLGLFIVSTFLLVCDITQQMSVESSGNLNGAVTSNVVRTVHSAHKCDVTVDLMPL
jgi:hypothetical protein